jgi:DNA-3-methyladenine glycosylase I
MPVESTDPASSVSAATARTRCAWANESDLMIAYHDTEWGVPVHDDQRLFEKLILEGFQAGLSWRTVLHKRENFRAAFDNFDAEKIARYDDTKLAMLMQDTGIIRNRRKLEATVHNARAYLQLIEQQGGFSNWLWSFVGHKTILPTVPRTRANTPTTSLEAIAMSKALKKASFTFVGPTICYAFMQSMGMVDDHVVECFKYSGAPN